MNKYLFICKFYLIKIVYHKANVRIRHFLDIPLCVHSSPTWGCIHFLE